MEEAEETDSVVLVSETVVDDDSRALDEETAAEVALEVDSDALLELEAREDELLDAEDEVTPTEELGVLEG